jgi:hypothetical protein
MEYTVHQFNNAVIAFDMLEDFHTIGTERGVSLVYKGEVSGVYDTLYEAMTDAIENGDFIISNQETLNKMLSAEPKPKKKQKALSLPKHISYSLVVQPERKIVLSYSGVKVSLEEAESIIDFLFSLSGSRYRKPMGQWFDKEDIYPNIKKLISNGSLTKIQAKYICMNHCSQYVWNTEIAA